MMEGLETAIPEGFNGVVSVLGGGKVLLRKAYGYANLPDRIGNALDTRFATASAGKLFVAIGILRLVEQGLLSLSDSLGKLLDFDPGTLDPRVTVRQLLTHTSGVPDYFDESVMEDYEELWRDLPNYRIRRSRDLLPLFIGKPMGYEPGSRFRYNNSGYVLLGIIIEILTGMPFDEYLGREVFARAGMTGTGYFELDRLPANCATAYILDREGGGYRTNIYSVDAKGSGAGGAFTTLADVEKLWTSLSGGGLLSAGTVEAMASLQASDGEEAYGYGLWLARREGRLIPYFQGCDPGVSFISSHDRVTGNTITMISNVGDNVWKMESRLDGILRGRP